MPQQFNKLQIKYSGNIILSGRTKFMKGKWMKMKYARRLVKLLFFVILFICVLLYTAIIYLSFKLPDSFTVAQGTSLETVESIPINIKNADKILFVQGGSATHFGSYDVEFELLGVIPVASAKVNSVKEDTVCVLGTPFGIKIYSDGVMVVGISDIEAGGRLVNPSSEAGIRQGDIILTINGVEVSSNNDVALCVEESGGKSLKFEIKRDAAVLTKTVSPVYSEADGKYKIGLWVRDSSAGIGTLTFYHPASNTVAGLGHAISDADTGEIIPLNYGELVGAEILDVTKGENGCPGELKGCFLSNTIGEFTENCPTGVYGSVYDAKYVSGGSLQIGYKQEIEKGKAQIYATVDGTSPKLYNCVIERIELNDTGKTKNMTVRITDEELLQTTGGIVQGMSGSPILQNGKLIGAITHVFVDDPTKGYAIFAENMLDTAQAVAEEQLKDAS